MAGVEAETILGTIFDTHSSGCGRGQDWLLTTTPYQGVLDTTVGQACDTLSLGYGDLLSLKTALLSFAWVAEVGSKVVGEGDVEYKGTNGKAQNIPYMLVNNCTAGLSLTPIVKILDELQTDVDQLKRFFQISNH